MLENLYEASVSFITLYDNSRDVLEMTAYKGKKWQWLSKMTIQRNEGIVGCVFATKQPLIADDIRQDERITFKAELLAMGVKSILCLPLVVKGNAIGVEGNRVAFYTVYG